MSNRWALALLAILGALAVVLVWTVGEGAASAESPEAPRLSPRADGAQRARPEIEAPLVAQPESQTEPSELSPTPIPSAGATSGERRVATSMRDEERAEGRWIEGRVVFPEGSPEDERLFVEADGKAFETLANHRVEVPVHGRFRIAFGPRTKRGYLKLEARYLYLPETVRVRPGEVEEPVILEPLVGSRIRGKVILPEDCPVSKSDIVGGHVLLSGDGRVGNNWRSVNRRATVASDLSFAFDAVRPEFEYSVTFDHERLQRSSFEPIILEGGETMEVALELQVGVAIAGRVVDEDDIGVAQAAVSVHAKGERSWRRPATSVDTEPDGSFVVWGVEPGELVLEVEKKGFEDVELELGELADRDVRSDVQVLVSRGSFVAGRVEWADNTPAVDALVYVKPVDPQASDSFDMDIFGGGWKTDSEGAFHVSGLPPGPYDVTVRGTHVETVMVKSRVTGLERPRKSKQTWVDAAHSIEAGTSNLLFTLTPGTTIRGRVVDDRGVARDRFRISAQRTDSDNWSPTDMAYHSFSTKDGTFELAGLSPGKWEVQAWDRDQPSEEIEVVLPDQRGAVELVLPRLGTVTGTVVDPGGDPVRRAQVELSAASQGVGRERDRTDAEGRFELDRGGLGNVRLRAHGNGFAPSAWLDLDLASGQAMTGVVLRLRTGGKLVGQFLTHDGKPIPRSDVSVYAEDHHESTQTNAQGVFELEHLAPGEYQVSATASASAARRLLKTDVDLDDGSLFEATDSVTVADARVSEVTLHAPDVTPIRIYGEVSLDGEPLESAWLSISSGDWPGFGFSDHFEGQSTYETYVPGPGSYVIQVQSWTGLRASHQLSVTIPDVSAFEFDVAIRTGTVAGRVLDSTGRPVPNVGVSMNTVADAERRSDGFTQTDDNGNYELALSAGEYFAGVHIDEDANDLAYELLPQGTAAHVRSGERVSLDLHLTAGGALRGQVRRADGAEIDGLIVRVLDADEQHIDSIYTQDSAGHFEFQRIPVGPVIVRIEDEGQPAAEDKRVRIVSGEVTEVEFELE